jgi:hypothetical protein
MVFTILFCAVFFSRWANVIAGLRTDVVVFRDAKLTRTLSQAGSLTGTTGFFVRLVMNAPWDCYPVIVGMIGWFGKTIGIPSRGFQDAPRMRPN